MRMKRCCVYFNEPYPRDRWFKGDHRLRAPLRRLVRGPTPVGGIKSVYVNLLKGLDQLGFDYATNIPFAEIRASDMVGVIGLGTRCLDGYKQENPILAGVAVAQHPAEWPTLFDDYPVANYVVHSDWVKSMYERHYGPRISTWAVGIDTTRWAPRAPNESDIDILIYDKVMWDHDRVHNAMVHPIIDELKRRGLRYEIIRYGAYKPDEYLNALHRAKAMLFLCEHETQGLAYQQAMSCGVPILAWDPGQWLDPWRYRYGETYVPSTSVPFFDERCGARFQGLPDFVPALDAFWETLQMGGYKSRDYVLDNLTLERASARYVELLRLFND